jgi:hypothetical protein
MTIGFPPLPGVAVQIILFVPYGKPMPIRPIPAELFRHITAGHYQAILPGFAAHLSTCSL